MKSKLAFIFAAPLLFCVLGFQGSCHSQCEELRQELIKDCRNDLGPNSERCREDQKKFQEACHEESPAEYVLRRCTGIRSSATHPLLRGGTDRIQVRP